MARQTIRRLTPLSGRNGAGLRKSLAMILLAGICLGAGADLHAEAKKKGGGKADAEIQKGLEPINAALDPLLLKVQARALLSPEEAGKLTDLKYKLLDLVDQFPQNALLAKPVYQAALLFSLREEYSDAYELFGVLSGGFAASPYGIRAKGQMQQLEKRLGPDYFATMGAAASVAAPTGGAAPAKGKAK